MRMIGSFFAEVWRRRLVVAICLFATPVIAVFWSIGRAPDYVVATTLYLENEKVPSPLLNHIEAPDHIAILERVLTNGQLLEDTLYDTGLLMEGVAADQSRAMTNDLARRLRLEAVSDRLMRITWRGEDPNIGLKVLENLRYHFVDELSAPERFHDERRLNSLAGQVAYYARSLRETEAMLAKAAQGEESQERAEQIARLEFEKNRLATQQQMAERDYDTLLAKVRENRQAPALRFVEPPTILTPAPDAETHIKVACRGFVGGLFLAIFVVLFGRLTDTTLRNEDEVMRALGVKVLGRMPNLGPVRAEGGRLAASVPQVI